MSGFSVTPADLRKKADELSDCADGMEEHIALRYFMNPREIGHEVLEAEVDEFQRQLIAAVAVLREDTEEMSHRLRLTASDYDETDRAAADRIRSAADQA
jgi:hypothetical protein